MESFKKEIKIECYYILNLYNIWYTINRLVYNNVSNLGFFKVFESGNIKSIMQKIINQEYTKNKIITIDNFILS